MNTKRRTVRIGLAAIAASSALVLGACGGGGDHSAAGGQHPATAPGGGNPSASNVKSCVASSKILNNAQSYTGKEVTVTGTVAQVVTPHAVTIAPNTNNDGGILGQGNNNSNNTQVLAVAKDPVTLTAGSPAQVTGILQPNFDPNHAATFTGGNIGQATWTPYQGRPYVQAEFTGPISANLTHENQGGIVSSSNCAAASDVLSNMQSYTGQQVTITGKVDQIVGPHAVTIASAGNTNGNNAQPVLAVAKELSVTNESGALTPGSPVQVIGTLQPSFEMNQAVAFAGSNLDPTAFAPYNGKAYVQAAYAGPVSANLTPNQTGS